MEEIMADSNVVLVTGASTGFGRLISVTLARRGYTVFASMRDLTGRNRSRAAELEEDPTAIFGNAAEAADQARAVDYGAVAEMPRKILEGLASNNNDVQEVADRVVELIEMPAGSRPVRSLVGTFAQQCQPLNDLALQFQTGALQAFGLSDLMALRRAERQ